MEEDDAGATGPRSQAARMAVLFAGHEGAYGTHGDPIVNGARGGKREIKSTARTLVGAVTVEMWEDHLAGGRPLGVIPIREDSTCLWGAIDVDRYDLVLGEVAAELERRGAPLVACRSKSGGLHAYVFLSEPAPAAEVRGWLAAAAAAMGWAGSEIFPKQSEVRSDRGDVGNWMTMPYHGGDATERYGVRPGSGLPMRVGEFLDWAEARRGPLSAARQPRAVAPKTKRGARSGAGPLADGPPCLQHLTASGFPDGTRNSGLFNLALYARRKWADGDWAAEVRRMNRESMVPPLPDEEVDGVIDRVASGKYNYQCRSQPCVSYCDAGTCRTRTFGVGGGDEDEASRWPTLSNLTKLDADPPLWFVDVDGRRLELTNPQLWNYAAFAEVALAHLNRAYRPVKRQTWTDQLAALMDVMTIIEVPPEVSTAGVFWEKATDFLTGRFTGTERDALLGGRPYFCEEEGKYYFRMQDLMLHLDREGFRQWSRTKIVSEVRRLGGGDRYWNIKGRGTGSWWLPRELFVADEGGAEALPPSAGAPI